MSHIYYVTCVYHIVERSKYEINEKFPTKYVGITRQRTQFIRARITVVNVCRFFLLLLVCFCHRRFFFFVSDYALHCLPYFNKFSVEPREKCAKNTRQKHIVANVKENRYESCFQLCSMKNSFFASYKTVQCTHPISSFFILTNIKNILWQSQPKKFVLCLHTIKCI